MRSLTTVLTVAAAGNNCLLFKNSYLLILQMSCVLYSFLYAICTSAYISSKGTRGVANISYKTHKIYPSLTNTSVQCFYRSLPSATPIKKCTMLIAPIVLTHFIMESFHVKSPKGLHPTLSDCGETWRTR